MDRFDRIYDLHKILSAARHPVPRQRIERELECSRATAKRIIEAMRLYLNAPIKYDRELNGYYYDPDEGDMYELPGVWFNSSELLALLSTQELLRQIQPGLLERQLSPLRGKIDSLLRSQHAGGDALSRKIRILPACPQQPGDHFQVVAAALARGKRLQITYHRRSDDTSSERTLSPQRLVHYRDNWYLDAWCHLRKALRTFSIDAITLPRVLDEPSRSIAETELDRHYAQAYGIFSGPGTRTAHLRFSAQRARWISTQQWHPRQETQRLADGRLDLMFPYGNPAELIMDILRHGPEVEVIGPPELREAVRGQLQKTLDIYK
jgi:proteasome accessory factor C